MNSSLSPTGPKASADMIWHAAVADAGESQGLSGKHQDARTLASIVGAQADAREAEVLRETTAEP